MSLSENSKVTPYANSVFEQPWWLDVVAPGRWRELTVEENGEGGARWPIVVNKNKAVMPKLTQTLGIWIKPIEGESVPNRLSRTKELIEKLYNQAPVRYWDCSLSPNCDYVLPFRWLGFSFEPRFTYVIDELTNLEYVKASASKTFRKNLRRAMKETSLIEKAGFDDLLACMKATYAAQNRKLPVSEELVSSLYHAALENGAGRLIAVGDEQGNVYDCTLFVFDEKRCYPLIGGSKPEYHASCGKTRVLWEGIVFASANSRAFDFEGSMIEGIEAFYRRFGGVPRVYYSIKKTHIADACLNYLKPRAKSLIGYKQ